MPHSSGGGSRGCGSHGGSHGGSGGGGSAVATSSHYFTGSHCYVYYRRGRRPRYIYTARNYNENKVSVWLKTIITVGFCLLFLAVFLADTSPVYSKPRKIKAPVYNPEIIDEAEVLGDYLDSLYGVMGTFQERTGVTPCILTVPSRAWMGIYESLEHYAYARYVDMFADEDHWLLVYSPTASGDWYWEGMQGDNTDPALPEETVNQFNKHFQDRLYAQSRYTVEQALRDSLLYYTDIMQVGHFDPIILVVYTLFILVILSVIYSQIHDLVMLKKCFTDAYEIPSRPEKPKNLKCEYCGNWYVPGIHVQCPYCGAPLKPE